MTKQIARLDNWVALPNREFPVSFVGEISEHPRQAEFFGAVQRTSRVVDVDYENNRLETRNTIYILGTECPLINKE